MIRSRLAVDMDALRGALSRNDPDAVAAALDDLKARDRAAHIEGLRLVLSRRRKRGDDDGALNGIHYQLAEALEATAAEAGASPADAAANALEAARVLRDVLNDGEGATRALTLALRVAAEDDAVLKDVVREAGGSEPSTTMLEKAAKKAGKSRDDDAVTGRLRRALARVVELFLFDKERAFFEALKAARKLPGEGALVDDVYRLAVETKRLDEAAAFFQSLADEGAVSGRARASALNKLGALHEERGDETAAFAAYVGSLQHHETKGARKKAERLKHALNVSTPLPSPRDGSTALPAPVPAPAPWTEPVVDTRPPAMALDLDLPPVSERPATTTVSASTSPSNTNANANASPVPQFPIVFPDTPLARVGLPPPVRVSREDIGLVTAVTDRPLLSIPPPPPDDNSGEGHDEDGAGAFSSAFTDEARAHEPVSEEHDAHDAIVSSEDDVAPALRFAAAREDARRAAAAARGLVVDDANTRTAISAAPIDARDLPTVQPTEALVVTPVETAPTTTTPTSPSTATLPPAPGVDERPSLATLAIVARALADGAVAGPGASDGFPSSPFVTDPAAVPFVSDPGVVVTDPEVRALPAHRAPVEDVVTVPAAPPRDVSAALLVKPSPASLPSSNDDAAHASDFTSHEASVELDVATGRKVKKGKASKKKKPARGHTNLADEATLPAGTAKRAPPPEASPPEASPSSTNAAPASLVTTAPVREAAPDSPAAAPPVMTTTRDDLVARAHALLQSDDVDGCLAVAFELSGVAPGEPRMLRLAARALLLEAPQGALTARAVALVVDEARRHGDRAATLIREIQLALPPEARGAHGLLWLAGARAAGHDADRVHALLEDVAIDDAPSGPLFSFLDATLATAGDVDRRDALVLRAARSLQEQAAAAVDDDARGSLATRRAAVLRRRVTLLDEAGRDGAALQAWSQLVLDTAVDTATRLAARRAHEQKATPDERARFLARLSRRADADGVAAVEVASILRELLDLRVAVDDHVGAEATARELLARVPGDARAIGVLADLLADDPRRAGEFVDVLRQRVDAARASNDRPALREALERLARALAAEGRDDEAAAALVDAARTTPGDAALVERVLDGLLQKDRVGDAVDVLEEIAAGAAAKDAARVLVRAADLARDRLGRKDRARALLERARTLQPHDARVLEANVELLVDAGDAEGALDALARLAADEEDARARARLELRMGLLLEEQLLRPELAITRYRAAVDGDRSLREAWDALLSLSRAQGDKAGVAAALTGLAQLESGRVRAALLVRLGRVQDKERGDAVAAAAAYEAALVADAGDVDALAGLLGVRALALQGERDVDAALAVPAPELVDEMRRPLLQAEAVGAALPFGFRRLLALAVTQDGDTEGARRRFEALLEEKPDDLSTLLAFARHLAVATRLPSASASSAAAVADARRREVLEAVLLHHAYALKPLVHVDVWGDVCALRLQAGDLVGAKKAAKKALALIAASDRPSELEDALSDRAVRALVLSLEDILPSDTLSGTPVVDDADIDALERAIALDFERALAASEKARLKEKEARVALVLRRDADAARKLLDEALRHDPDASSAREALFDLELQGEDPRRVLEHSRALVAAERDPQKKAQLHLRLFKLHKRLRLPDDVAAAEIKNAVELDPKNQAILEAAERFFVDKKDGKGLDALYTTRLKSLDRSDVAGRLFLLERLAQVRRYDVRDLRGAIDACEAMSALDPEAIKPREDAARIHVELGQWKEAVAAWRAVLDRDTLLVGAWRGLFSVFARSRQADEAYAVAATMAALEIADDEMVRAVRAVRPPFPRWPVPPADLAGARRRLSHPLERSPVRAVLEIVAPRLLPRLGRPLSDFGVRRKDALVDKQLSPSVSQALRTSMALAGLGGARDGLRDVLRDGAPLLPLYGAELSSDGATPPFAALPAREPGLIVTAEVLRGGMTPERAFALGRAVAWLSPWALLAAALDTVEIRRLLEGLVASFLSPRDLEKPSVELERYGAELRGELFDGLPSAEREQLTSTLTPALRDWVVGRQRVGMSEWKAGVGYTGDRIGFLLCGDLPSAVRVVRAAGGSTTAARLSIKELVLFSISPVYLQLRREFALAMQEQALAPILDLG